MTYNPANPFNREPTAFAVALADHLTTDGRQTHPYSGGGIYDIGVYPPVDPGTITGISVHWSPGKGPTNNDYEGDAPEPAEFTVSVAVDGVRDQYGPRHIQADPGWCLEALMTLAAGLPMELKS